MRCISLPRVGAGLLVLLASTAVIQSQEPSNSMAGVFSEVLDVRVVNLEVVVTDKDGVPVRGLSPDNFLLTIDGEEVPIEYFSEVRAGVAAPVSEEQQQMGVAELPAVIAGDPVETSYLVFIDEFFAIARDRNKVIEGLLEDLPRMGPKDRMAIVAYNGTSVDMLTTWSQSIPALERTLKDALERPVYGLRRLAEQRQFDFDRLLRASFEIRDGVLDGQRFLRTDLLPDERYFLEKLTEQVQGAVTAAALTLRSFAMPPGRKVMLVYSGGWPFFPVSFLGPFVSPIVQAPDSDRGAQLFRPLSDTANLLGYTLYPVDMPGFNDLVATGTGRLAATSAPVPQEFGFETFRREQEMHISLLFLAKETGGEAFLNERRVRALEETVSDTRSYYWLGFSPERDWDDRRHKVEVALKQTGFRVRARGSFLDSSKQHEVAMALESTLLFGSPSGAEALRVEVGESRKVGRKRVEVPISLYIPLTELIFLPDAGGQVAQLELHIAVRDEEGRRAEVPVIPVMIRIDTDPEPGTYGKFETGLKLRSVQHEAVLGIFDPSSGRILSATVEISP